MGAIPPALPIHQWSKKDIYREIITSSDKLIKAVNKINKVDLKDDEIESRFDILDL